MASSNLLLLSSIASVVSQADCLEVFHYERKEGEDQTLGPSLFLDNDGDIGLGS